MKRTILGIILFLCLQVVKAQDNNSVQKPVLSVEVVSIKDLKNVVYSSNKKLKIVYFFKRGCSANAESMPKINTLYKTQKSNIDLFVVSFANKNNMQDLKDHFFFEGYYTPVYIIDDSAIFNNKKYRKVVESLCDDCDQKFMGYADFFILDENNSLIAQSSYSQNLDEHIQLLKSQLD